MSDCGLTTVSLEEFNGAFNSAAFCVKSTAVVVDDSVLSYLNPADYFEVDSDGRTVERTSASGGGTEAQEMQWAPQYATAGECDCSECEWVTRDGFANDEQFQAAICDAFISTGALGSTTHALHVVKLATMLPTERLLALEAELGDGLSFHDFVAAGDTSRHGFFTVDVSLETAAALRGNTEEFAAVFPMPFDLKWSPEIFASSARGGLPAVGFNSMTAFSINIAAGSLATDADAETLAAKWQSALDSNGIATASFVGSSKHIIEVVGLEDLEDLRVGGSIVAAQPEVLSMEPKRTFFAHNKYSQGFTQSGEVGKPTLWEHGLHGEGEVVGFADSGLDHQSCFFRDDNAPLTIANNALNNNPGHRKVVQYAAFADNEEGELGGHGTHVGGSIAGHAIDENGLELHNGMAYASTLAFFDIGEAGQPFLNVPGALENTMFPVAYDIGARIHTNSWGSRGNGYSSNSRSVDVFSHEQQDFLILFAAGNDGAGGAGTVGAPATAKNALSVGASYSPTESFSEEFGAECALKPCEDRIASFSSLGPASDGRTKPDLVAPGFYIVSAESQANPSTGHCSVFPNAGTSMATPVVAGLAALVRQYMREGFYPIGVKNTADYGFNPMGALVKGLLINSGSSLKYPLGNGVGAAGALPSMTQGFGKVTVGDTLFFPNSTRVLYVDGDFDNMPSLSTGESKTYTFFVYESLEDFKVTLVWHDAPASTQSTRQLVNDLDLTVTTPDGTTLFPNGLAVPDTLNNVEQVVVAAGEVSQGQYTVTVRGTAVPVGPQPFAVVTSGDFVRGADKFPNEALPRVAEISFFESQFPNGTIDYIQVAARITHLPGDETNSPQKFNIWCQDPLSDDVLNGLDSYPRMQADLDIQETVSNGEWILRADLDVISLQSLTDGQGLDSDGEWKWACPDGLETVGMVVSSGLTSETLQVVFVEAEVLPNGATGGGNESSGSDLAVAIAASVVTVGAVGMLGIAYFVSKNGAPRTMAKFAATSDSKWSRGSTKSNSSKGWNQGNAALAVLGDHGAPKKGFSKEKTAWISTEDSADIL
jgi:hypothetical protein